MISNGLRSVLPRVTLREHGAPSEIRGSITFNLDKTFDQYEEFWRFHIAPCTNRPLNVQWREGIAKEIEHIGQISYGIWTDLVDASESLERVALGDFGSDYRHCRDCLKHGGNAMQKFGELEKAIEGPHRPTKSFPNYWLAKRLNRSIKAVPQNLWDADLGPRREAIIGYRNYLVHEGNPPVVLDENFEPHAHFVLRKEFLIRGNPPAWSENGGRYVRSPHEYGRFEAICNEIHSETIRWLNDGYRHINAAMAPLLQLGAYIALSGTSSQFYAEIPEYLLNAMQTMMPSGVTGIQRVPRDSPDLNTT